jgi:DNA-binding MarR family transcriptional regulator
MDQRIFDDPRTDRHDDSRTVILTGRDLRDAARLLRAVLGTLDREAPASGHDVSKKHRKALVELARQVFSDRRRRVRQFGPGMFGEPGWDILLTLYTEEDRTRFQISRLLDASGSPATTGLRWLEYLEAQQLVCRESNPTDARSYFIELTDKGRSGLDSYFSETLTKER